MTKILTVILIVFFFSCTSSNDTKKETKAGTNQVQSSERNLFPVKELFVDNGEEEGWGADIRLSITWISKTDTSVTYFANSLYEGKNIGLTIIIPTVSPESEKVPVHVLTLQCAGQISNDFIHTLSKLYKEKVDTSLHFVNSKRIAFIDLNEFAKKEFGKEPVNKTAAREMKVFFESENPDDNAELYVNINESEHWIEIREKDEGYRKQVIKGLTGR